MKNNYQILIVGGGNAGLSVAAQLLRKESSLKIGIIEPSQRHYYQPAMTLVAAGIYNYQKTIRKEAELIPQNADWINDEVVEFYPEMNQLECKSGQIIQYDILIVCAGIQLNWNQIGGLKETLGKNEISSNYFFDCTPYTWDIIKNFKGGTAVFTNPSTPIKCGGAPHKIMYLAVDYWRKKGILDKCKVHYISGGSCIFGIPEYAETLSRVIEDGNIRVHYNSKLISINGNEKTLIFECGDSVQNLEQAFSDLPKDTFSVNSGTNDNPGSRVTLYFDMCHAVPPQSAPDFIKNSKLSDEKNTYGYIEIHPETMQHKRYMNIFALGDCINAPCSKTGAAIRKQAPVVVQNVLALMHNSELKAQYDGYSACPIPTQYGKLMLAEFDYSNKPKMTFPFNQARPAWSMWLLKTKILPWLYWNRILKGKA